MPSFDGVELLAPWRLTLCLMLLLSAAGCDEFPGRDVIGVGRVPDGGIVVTKILCPGDRVIEVSLVLAPRGVPRFGQGDILWRITSKAGTTQETFVLGVTPAGFVEAIPLSRTLRPNLGLAATIDTERESEALMDFTPRQLPEHELVTRGRLFRAGRVRGAPHRAM